MANLATTLYDLSVPTFLQTVRAVGGFLDRTTRHCAETGADLEELVKARLFPDMAPFHFQIEALTHHAVWGLEAVKSGMFAPPPLIGAMPFADLRAMVGQAITALEAFTPDEVNSWSGKNLDIDIFRPVDEKNASTSVWAPRTFCFDIRDLSPHVLAAQLLFSLRYGLQHPPNTRGADRKRRLRGSATHPISLTVRHMHCSSARRSV